MPEASCEEYIDGEEFTFDTVCIGGEPAYENIAQYLPKPIEARSLEWVSPVIITVRDMYQEQLAPGVRLGRQVLRALKMGDRFLVKVKLGSSLSVVLYTVRNCRQTENGYRIGAYPAKPLKGDAQYVPPPGFIEVTKENQDTKVSPHFVLKQFLGK